MVPLASTVTSTEVHHSSDLVFLPLQKHQGIVCASDEMASCPASTESSLKATRWPCHSDVIRVNCWQGSRQRLQAPTMCSALVQASDMYPFIESSQQPCDGDITITPPVGCEVTKQAGEAQMASGFRWGPNNRNVVHHTLMSSDKLTLQKYEPQS